MKLQDRILQFLACSVTYRTLLGLVDYQPRSYLPIDKQITNYKDSKWFSVHNCSAYHKHVGKLNPTPRTITPTLNVESNHLSSIPNAI